jgi:rod shape-determining protein MreC
VFQRRRARILLVVVLLSALVLVTLDFRGEREGPLEGLREVATSVFRPVQDGVTILLSPVGDVADRVRELFAIRAENRELRERVEELEQRRSSMRDLARENDALRDLLEMRERTELETVAGRTVALAPSNFEWTITIDVGSDDGVDRDMPVIDGDGLVGRVIQVTPGAARVLLAIDPNFSAAARTATTGEIGSIDGRGGDPMLLSMLDTDATVEVGEEIVTSSFDGGVFPAGIPVGTVREVGEGDAGLSREVDVSPFVDFTRLDHVLVLRSTAVDELPPFEGTEGLDVRRPGADPDDGAETDEDDGPDEDDEGDGPDEDDEGDGEDADDEGDGEDPDDGEPDGNAGEEP